MRVRLKEKPSEKRFWNLYTDGLTQSAIAKFLICPEKFRLYLEQGWGAEEIGGARGFGSLFHRALEQVYRAQGGEPPESFDIQAALKRCQSAEEARLARRDASARQWQDFEKDLAISEVLLSAYFEKWNRDFERFRWESLEQTFQADFPVGRRGAIPIRGKLDGALRTKDGRLWLFETKTKSVIDDPTLIEKLHFDLQVGVYLWAMEQIFNERPAGALYNLVKRPTLRQKKSETLPQFARRVAEDIQADPGAYFRRYEVRITPAQQDRLLSEIAHTLTRIERAYLREDPYPRSGGNCVHYNRNCEFLAYCANGVSHIYAQRDAPFPELEDG